jgi:DNA polymerase-1
MQNIPDIAQVIFEVQEEGNVLVKADYSNLELRVLAQIAQDKPLIELFKRGENVHDQNTKDLWEISEDHPKWKSARHAAKTYIFGRNYGGGLRGIFERVALAVPDLNLTFSQFSKADNRFRRAHPAITKWTRKTEDTVRSTRTLRNAFGRVRYFLGDMESIVRSGLNFPIQSTAADVLNYGLIKLDSTLPRSAKLCATVHDSIIVECKKSQIASVVKAMKAAMEAPVKINGKMVSFPVDFEVGTSWGKMNEYKVKET